MIFFGIRKKIDQFSHLTCVGGTYHQVISREGGRGHWTINLTCVGGTYHQVISREGGRGHWTINLARLIRRPCTDRVSGTLHTPHKSKDRQTDRPTKIFNATTTKN